MAEEPIYRGEQARERERRWLEKRLRDPLPPTVEAELRARLEHLAPRPKNRMHS